MVKVVIKEMDYNDYRIGLTNGEDTIYIFKAKSKTDAGYCKDCMEAGLKAAVQYFRLNVPWKLRPY